LEKYPAIAADDRPILKTYRRALWGRQRRARDAFVVAQTALQRRALQRYVLPRALRRLVRDDSSALVTLASAAIRRMCRHMLHFGPPRLAQDAEDAIAEIVVREPSMIDGVPASGMRASDSHGDEMPDNDNTTTMEEAV
jgi:hypothetical protein